MESGADERSDARSLSAAPGGGVRAVCRGRSRGAHSWQARALGDFHVVHVNSTYYGSGVAQTLSSLTLLMNSAGVRTGWRVIEGRPEFFSVTKKMHNALQGGEINLTDAKMRIYEEVAAENAARMHLDLDLVIIHEPQPLPTIRHFRR